MVFDWVHFAMFAAGIAIPLIQKWAQDRQAAPSSPVIVGPSPSQPVEPQLTIGHGLLLHLLGGALSQGLRVAQPPTPVPVNPVVVPSQAAPAPLDMNALLQQFFSHMALQMQQPVVPNVSK